MVHQNFDPDWDGLFREIRDEMVAWRRAHPKATLREIELENERLLARLHARMVADIASASAQAHLAGQPPATRAVCPHCQVPLVARGRKQRTLRSHGNQPVPLARDYGSCPQCGQAFSPLDEELQLLPGELTPLLHERLIQVGTVARSFAAGAEIFTAFTRTSASEPTARRYAERAGAVLEACAREETAADPAAADDPRPVWVGADGVMVRLVGGGWREVRTVTIGRVNPPVEVDAKERVTTTALSYFSRLTDGADVFIEAAAGEFHRRGVAGAALVGAGADGADWCQDLFDRYCPDAARCLDFYHAGQRVHAFSKALWPAEPALAAWYAGEQLHQLKHTGPATLLASLNAWSQAAADPKVRQAAAEQAGFFSGRKELLDYPGIRARGLPIGTGNAESANLHVVQDRMKGPGKFWGREHVNPMLALRNAWCSERWDEAWAATSTRLTAGHYPVRLVHVPKAKS